MYKEELLNVSYAMREQLVLSMYETDNCLVGIKDGVEYRILVIANQVELSAHVLQTQNDKLPVGWYLHFVEPILANFTQKLVIKESDDVVINMDETVQVDVYREDDEASEEDTVAEEVNTDDGSLDSFDPMEYAASSMVGAGDFMRFSKEYFGEDAKVKTPEIVIEEQKAEGLRDTTDELTNPEPDKSLLDRLKEEMEKLSDEEQKALLEEVGVETIEELFEDDEEIVFFPEDEEQEIEIELPIDRDLDQDDADAVAYQDEPVIIKPLEEIEKVEPEELPDLVLADTSDFEMDDWYDEDDCDDLEL